MALPSIFLSLIFLSLSGDTHLADLVAKHGFKFGILDGGIKHPATELTG
jgi:hypothetical protein